MTTLRARSVFISYSRKPASGDAQALYRALAEVLGPSRVYLDVGADTIPLGEDWRAAVVDAIERSDLLLLVVDPGLGPRLHDDANAVRFEVVTALSNQRRVVPVRVEGAEPLDAKHLSGPLELLANANSPAIRPDTAVSDVNRIVAELTGHTPGAVRVADRWDALVCGGFAAIAALAWATYGRRVMNVGETWLWAAAVVLPCLVWWYGRRLLRFPVSATGPSVVRYGAVRAFIILAASGLWATLAWRQYRLPHLPKDTGILVARFDGDPSDRVQHAWIERLSDERRKLDALPQLVAHEHALETVALPRRLTDDVVARRLAADVGASVVLWGKARTAGDSVIATSVHVEFVDRPGMIRHGGGVIEESGGLAGPEHLELSSDAVDLQSLLPRLLVAYDVYRDAADSLRASALMDLITASLTTTRARVAPDGVAQAGASARATRQANDPDAGDDAVRAVRAMLHFLRGNVHFRFGEDSAARADYREAVDASASRELASRPPTYVEALNNLVLLDILAARYDSAWARLQTGVGACPILAQSSRNGPSAPAACSYLAYHKGWLLQRRKQYVEADTAFKAVRPGPGVDELLLAKTHQALAYGAVRQASQPTSPSAVDSLLARAERDERDAVAIARRVLTDTTELRSLAGPWSITSARIALARRNWAVALDTLRRVLATIPTDPAARAAYAPAFALAATATKCIALSTGADSTSVISTLLTNFMGAARDFSELDEYQRVTASCTPSPR